MALGPLFENHWYVILVCFNVLWVSRPLSPFSVGCVCSWFGGTPCSRCPVSTPSAKDAGSSIALYSSKMGWEWVSSAGRADATCQCVQKSAACCSFEDSDMIGFEDEPWWENYLIAFTCNHIPMSVYLGCFHIKFVLYKKRCIWNPCVSPDVFLCSGCMHELTIF